MVKREQFMNGQPTLFVDQYGERHWAKTVKELLEKAGRTKAKKMYVDKKDGRTVHVGYVVGHSWFAAYRLVEMEV